MSVLKDGNVEVPQNFCSPGLKSLIHRLKIASDDEVRAMEKVESGLMLLATIASNHGDSIRDLTSAVANELGLEIVSLRDSSSIEIAQSQGLLEAIDPLDATKLRYFPLQRLSDEIVVGMVDPLDMPTVGKLSFAFGCPVRVVMVLEIELLEQLRKVRGMQAVEKAVAGQKVHKGVSIGQDTELSDMSGGSDADMSQNTAMIRLVNEMITNAYLAGSSDIHLEPTRDMIYIRFRVDGVLRNYLAIPKRLQPYLTTRLKLLGKMDITERRKPQDGRFRFTSSSGQNIDIRLSTVPTPIGEKIVMRLLINTQKDWATSALSMSSEMESRFNRLLEMHDRLFVVTGPTGSGKSTSLYTGIAELIKKGRHVVTVEDPIEYRFEGITQIQVDESCGVTFAAGLRSILRQDPEVILVGEIRDSETACCALQAAQTGHLVLSSLHCNSAVSTVTRLLDLGVSPSLLASSLGAVLAQRLVRVLCKGCAVPLSEDKKEELANRYGVNPSNAMEARGCERCGGTGYKGRMAIFSLMEITEELRLAIRNAEAEATMEQIAQKCGYCSLETDGLLKVANGVTTIDELERVIGLVKEASISNGQVRELRPDVPTDINSLPTSKTESDYPEAADAKKLETSDASIPSNIPHSVMELKRAFLEFDPWYLEVA